MTASSTIEVNGNADDGVFLQRNSSLGVFNNSTVNVVGNGGNGLELINSSAAVFSISITLMIKDNAEMNVLIAPDSVCNTCPQV